MSALRDWNDVWRIQINSRLVISRNFFVCITKGISARGGFMTEKETCTTKKINVKDAALMDVEDLIPSQLSADWKST